MPQPTAKRNQAHQAALRATIGYASLVGALLLFLAFGPSIGGQTNENSNMESAPAALDNNVERLTKPETPPSAKSSKSGKTLHEKRNSAVDVLNDNS